MEDNADPIADDLARAIEMLVNHPFDFDDDSDSDSDPGPPSHLHHVYPRSPSSSTSSSSSSSSAFMYDERACGLWSEPAMKGTTLPLACTYTTFTALPNGNALLVGGVSSNIPGPRDDPVSTSRPMSLLCDLATNSWELFTPPPSSYIPTPRHGHAAVLSPDGRYLYVVGGLSSVAPLGDPSGYGAPPFLERLCLATGIWSPVAKDVPHGFVPPHRIFHGAAFLPNSSILVVAGGLVWYDSVLSPSRAVYGFDVEKGAWLPPDTLPPLPFSFRETVSLVSMADGSIAILAVSRPGGPDDGGILHHPPEPSVSVAWLVADGAGPGAYSYAGPFVVLDSTQYLPLGSSMHGVVSVTASPISALASDHVLLVVRGEDQVGCYVLGGNGSVVASRVGPPYVLSSDRDLTIRSFQAACQAKGPLGSRISLVPRMDAAIHLRDLQGVSPLLTSSDSLLRVIALDDAPCVGPPTLYSLARAAVARNLQPHDVAVPELPESVLMNVVSEARLRGVALGESLIDVFALGNLSTVHVPWTEGVTSDWLATLVEVAPQITDLDLSGAPVGALSAQALLTSLPQLPTLSSLSLAYVSAVAREESLNEIIFALCETVSSWDLSAHPQLLQSSGMASFGSTLSPDQYASFADRVTSWDLLKLHGRAVAPWLGALLLTAPPTLTLSLAGCALLPGPATYARGLSETVSPCVCLPTEWHAYLTSLLHSHAEDVPSIADLAALWDSRRTPFTLPLSAIPSYERPLLDPDNGIHIQVLQNMLDGQLPFGDPAGFWDDSDFSDSSSW